jgi:hypothetical protein
MYTLDFGIRTTSASQADEFRIQHLATFALQHRKLLTTDTHHLLAQWDLFPAIYTPKAATECTPLQVPNM